MVVVHQSMMEQRERFLIELRRYMYVTPKNFLDYISNYRSGMKSARKDNGNQTKRLSGGLAKLVEAAEAVAVLQEELKKKMVIVNAKTVDCTAMIKDIKEKTKVADESKVVAIAKNEELTEMAKGQTFFEKWCSPGSLPRPRWAFARVTPPRPRACSGCFRLRPTFMSACAMIARASSCVEA